MLFIKQTYLCAYNNAIIQINITDKNGYIPKIIN